MKKKVLAYLLAAAMVLTGTGTAQPARAEEIPSGEEEEILEESQEEGASQEAPADGFSWGEGTLGNRPAAILGGGRLAEAPDGGVYFSEEGAGTIQYRDGQGNVRTVAGREGRSLNVFEDAVYYASDGGVIRKYQPSTGQDTAVLEWEEEISQFYVVDQEGIYFLAGGSLYGGLLAGEIRCVREAGDIRGFVPTRFGMLYAKGTAMDWEIWAGDTQVASHVSNWDCQDGYLILSIEGEDYQKSLEELFSGVRSAAQLEVYQMGETHSVEELLGHGEECPVCAANSQRVAEGLEEVEEEAQELEQTAAVSAYASVSQGQKNIVKRAEQQYFIQWTPLEDLPGWNKQYTFEAGTTYQGIPYGQPIKSKLHEGQYVPFDENNVKPAVSSLQDFLDAVSDPDSRMYTKTATYNKVAPYYSSDCSAFVSYAWGLSRQTTASLPGDCTEVSSQSIYSAQVGDMFNKSGNHTVLVAEVGYDSDGTVAYIDILQQTPPKVKLTRYGEGGERTLAELQEEFLGSDYTLYRFDRRSSVRYTHSCAVPVDQDYCSQCGSESQLYFEENDVWVKEGESLALSVTNTTGKSVSWKSMNPEVVSVDAKGNVTGLTEPVQDGYGHEEASAVIQASAGGKTAVCTVHVIRERPVEPEEPEQPEEPEEDWWEPTVEGFVKRLYKLVLGRTPTESEMTGWVSNLKSGKEKGVDTAFGFVFSREYDNRDVGNRDFIRTLYQTMMNRTPKETEIDVWEALLDSGFTRYKVFEGFANSEEFRNVCQRYGILQGSYTSTNYVDQHEEIAHFVARLYHICLLRNPKNEEVEAWTRVLVKGQESGGDVAHGFFFSEEFLKRKYSNEEYVRFLYETMMDREPDSSGLRDWVELLEDGDSRESVLEGFAQSVEFDRICRNYGIRP